jgi:hypothetical protein
VPLLRLSPKPMNKNKRPLRLIGRDVDRRQPYQRVGRDTDLLAIEVEVDIHAGILPRLL